MGTRTKAGPKAFPETDWIWIARAACSRAPDPKIFFPEDRYDVKTADGLSGYREDVAIVAEEWCSVCPVETVCRSHAVDTKESAGIWGGLGPVEREELRKVK